MTAAASSSSSSSKPRRQTGVSSLDEKTDDEEFMSLQAISLMLAKSCCKHNCLRKSISVNHDDAFLDDVEMVRILRRPLLGKSKIEYQEAVQGEIKGKPYYYLWLEVDLNRDDFLSSSLFRNKACATRLVGESKRMRIKWMLKNLEFGIEEIVCPKAFAMVYNVSKRKVNKLTKDVKSGRVGIAIDEDKHKAKKRLKMLQDDMKER